MRIVFQREKKNSMYHGSKTLNVRHAERKET